MKFPIRSAVVALQLIAVAAAFAQQPAIPVRNLGAIDAAWKDTLKAPIAVRGLSNGGALVIDVTRRQLRLFGPSLGPSKIIIDSAASAGTSAIAAAIPSASLIPFTGDTTLYVDLGSTSLLVMDATGKVARVMALPKPGDAFFIGLGVQFGMPAMDPKGRLVYRGVLRIPPRAPAAGATLFQMPAQPDSAPIVRADFDARTVDTVGKVKIPAAGETSVSEGNGQITVRMKVNPMLVTGGGDEWAVLPDGTIAIVRAHDYYIDWVDVNGKTRSTPKMPIDWLRLTDELKQKKSDSVRTLLDSAMKAQSANMTIPTPDGPRKMNMVLDMVPISEMADYEPAVGPGSVKAAPDGMLWVLPRTSAGTQGGLVYDVINRDGKIVERVRFPAGRALAGFGENGIVYLSHTQGAATFLERAKLR